MRKRVAPQGTGRRTVAGRAGGDALALDDRPLSVQPSKDGKRVVVALPYEVWIVLADSLEIEKTIELASPAPSVCESDEDGALWMGGTHLHRGSLWSATASKFGSKLGGFVDRVALVRPRLLCGAGTQGEILLDLEKEDVVHRRKAAEHEVLALVASPDGRAVWTEGAPWAWVVDPEHISGYMKLKLRATSPVDVPAESIVALGTTTTGATILAARDGAIAWTNRALRIVAERFPRMDLRHSAPLGVAGDERWIYALRPGGVLQRFLVAQPEPPPDLKKGEEPVQLPDAQTARLERAASCLAMGPGGTLLLAGPQADDQLGRLWRAVPDELQWSTLPLASRTLAEAPADAGNDEAPSQRPSFVPTRSKIAGAPLAQVRVDDVLGGAHDLWITRDHGTLLERATEPRAAAEVMPGDAVLLPAMIRLQEGTARPALLLWPGVVDELREIPPLEWITWGDRPRGWMPLRTPEIREQGWSRRGVFPLQVALASPPPPLPGRRATIPARWSDRDGFAAMVRECKKLLKVLW
jgi:hypothetical protein